MLKKNYEIAEPIKKVTNFKQLPKNNNFALLVKDSIPKQIKDNFDIKFIEQFDENYVKRGKRGHKSRRTLKLYLLERNNN